VEVHLSIDKGERKGGLAATDQSSLGKGKKPMVELYDRQALAGGGADTGLGAPSIDIISPHFVQCQPHKMSFEEKDVGEGVNFHIYHGEQANLKTDSSLPTGDNV